MAEKRNGALLAEIDINRVASIVEGTVAAQRNVEALTDGLTLTRADVERSTAQMAILNGQQKLLIDCIAELEQGIKAHKALLADVLKPAPSRY